MKYFFTVAVIWLGCAIAWVLLGSTLVYRSSASSSERGSEVDELWGPPLTQQPPHASYRELSTTTEKVSTVNADGFSHENTVTKQVWSDVHIPLVHSALTVELALEHRRKGLLWFPTYTVAFDGDYAFENDSSEPRAVTFVFPLASEHALYDGFQIQSGGQGVKLDVAAGLASFQRTLAAHERFGYQVRYRSRGRAQWRYQLSDGTGRVDDFELRAQTNFEDVDFPAGTLSPTSHASHGHSWHGRWAFDRLVSNAPIGLLLPQRQNPGPLASRITFFAPVGLLFFMFVAAVLSKARARPLHPMHYFFIGCAFFAFHLLFAYLVDHISLELGFAIASFVSVLLVVSYARLFLGWRAACALLGLPQLIYLVLFSYSFFWEGYTGLAIAVGAVTTLFVIMQITGRVRWDAPAPGPAPLPQGAA